MTKPSRFSFFRHFVKDAHRRAEELGALLAQRGVSIVGSGPDVAGPCVVIFAGLFPA